MEMISNIHRKMDRKYKDYVYVITYPPPNPSLTIQIDEISESDDGDQDLCRMYLVLRKYGKAPRCPIC